MGSKAAAIGGGGGLLKQLTGKSIRFHLVAALVLRLVLIVFSELQDRLFEVKYTDIDYVIFTDGAWYTLNGGSPFDRDTYRYTPFLAWLVTPNIWAFPQFGKFLFAAFDLLSGWLLYLILLPASSVPAASRTLAAIAWLYNPLTVIISTRGSAEPVICTLVIAALYLLLKKQYLAAGLVYGFVIHFKIYPVIYALSFYLVISNKKSWASLLPNRHRIVFFLATFIGLVVPTLAAYLLYGKIYLDEAWLYHFHRQDFQHNFSPYFYFYHLVSGDGNRRLLSLLAFAPQLALITYSAFYYLFKNKQKKDLFMSLFFQTVVFVTLNKVITAQYFEWYMCLFPLILPFFHTLTLRSWIAIFAFWSVAILQWLLPAYLLEFRKWNCLHWVGGASIAFVLIHLALLAYLHVQFNQKVKK